METKSRAVYLTASLGMGQTRVVADTADDRPAFTQRLLLQLRSRYPGVTIGADPQGFALRITGAGIDNVLPLSPLHSACQRDPARAPALITDWVRSVDRQMTPAPAVGLNAGRLLWCVRGRRYMDSVSRCDELVRRGVGADMTGFVAQALPGGSMRGVPLGDLEAAGQSQEQARAAADANTAALFASLPERIRSTDRIPGDGWRLASEELFQGSAVLVPDVLRAFAQRCGGDVLIGIPDRSAVLVVGAGQPSASRFGMRVVRMFREAMNPCSREVLISDGVSLHEHSRQRAHRRVELLSWIRD